MKQFYVDFSILSVGSCSFRGVLMRQMDLEDIVNAAKKYVSFLEEGQFLDVRGLKNCIGASNVAGVAAFMTDLITWAKENPHIGIRFRDD